MSKTPLKRNAVASFKIQRIKMVLPCQIASVIFHFLLIGTINPVLPEQSMSSPAAEAVPLVLERRITAKAVEQSADPHQENERAHENAGRSVQPDLKGAH
jgi:hypothetical protein